MKRQYYQNWTKKAVVGAASPASAAPPRSAIVYTLELQHGKFYVGKTLQPMQDRFQQHVQGTGAAWTRLHRPIRVMREDKCSSDHQEDNTTLDLMRVRGIDNVRGGVYCLPQLLPTDISAIKKSIAGISGACVRCFRTSHLASACYAKTDAYGTALTSSGDERKTARTSSSSRRYQAEEESESSSDSDSSDSSDSDSSEDDYRRARRRRRRLI